MADDAKLETKHLFFAYAAVDQQVQLHEQLQFLDIEGEHPAALLLPMYKESDNHWAPQYLKSAGPGIEQRYLESAEARKVLKPLEGVKPVATAKPLEGMKPMIWKPPDDLGLHPLNIPLAEAKVSLSQFAKLDPRCRMHARRLHAVAALARTFKQLEPIELTRAAVGPTRFKELSNPGPQADELARLLRRNLDDADPDEAPDIYWNGLFASTALRRPEVVGPRPCTGELRMITRDGDTDPVPTLTTVFEADIAFDEAIRFCDPLTWTCFPSWCSMKKKVNGRWVDHNGGKADWTDDKGDPRIRKYRESVSFDCVGKTMPKLTVDLDFNTRERQEDGQRVVITEYRLSEPSNQQDLLVNEGWLEVREISPQTPTVRVTATKSVQFREEYGGPWLAFISCHLGYLTMVEDLLCCAAKGPLPEAEAPDAFPGRKPSPPAARSSARAALSAEPDYASLIMAMADAVADAVGECIDEYSEAAKASYAKFEARSYKADDLTRDIADSWVRVLRKGAHVAQAGREAFDTASQPKDQT